MNIEKLNQELLKDLNELEKQDKAKQQQIKTKQDNLDLVKDLNKLESQRDIRKIKKIVRERGYRTKKIDKYIDKQLGKYAPKYLYIKNLKYERKYR